MLELILTVNLRKTKNTHLRALLLWLILYIQGVLKVTPGVYLYLKVSIAVSNVFDDQYKMLLTLSKKIPVSIKFTSVSRLYCTYYNYFYS